MPDTDMKARRVLAKLILYMSRKENYPKFGDIWAWMRENRDVEELVEEARLHND